MKKICSVLLALVLICGAAQAETRITVTGEGRVYVPADTCLINLGVTETNADALNAQSSVNAKIAAITAALIESGIRESDISTGQLYMYARYDYSGEIETVIGYNANCTISIRTDNVESAGSIIDTAFMNGANTLEGVTFGAKDTSDAENECLKSAAADAAQKAAVLAEAYGLTLGAPAEVSECSTYSSAMDNGYLLTAKAAGSEMPEEADDFAPTEVRSAMVCVSASLNVAYIAE